MVSVNQVISSFSFGFALGSDLLLLSFVFLSWVIVMPAGQLSWETNALASLRQRSRDQITFEDHARAVDLANYTVWLKHWLATDSCLKDGRVEEIFV